MSTRFDEDNCHAECVSCNCFDPNHLKGYFNNLLMKIGQDRLAQLGIRARQTKKWSDYELKELIKHYQQEVKELKENSGL